MPTIKWITGHDGSDLTIMWHCISYLANSYRNWKCIEVLVECDQHTRFHCCHQAVDHVMWLAQNNCKYCFQKYYCGWLQYTRKLIRDLSAINLTRFCVARIFVGGMSITFPSRSRMQKMFFQKFFGALLKNFPPQRGTFTLPDVAASAFVSTFHMIVTWILSIKDT